MLSAVQTITGRVMSDQTTKKERGWLLPDAKNAALPPGLYLVATPIGNLRDMSFRGLDTLSAASLVVCEDTRVSGKLLAYFGISKPLLPYNDHNAERQRGPILKKIRDGEAVAFINDAGSPLVSDPGYKLVRECIESGLSVTAIPGAASPIAALQLSGLPSDQFCFTGFLPPKSTARRKALEAWKSVDATLIAFETAPRLADALGDIRAVLGEREVAVAREITKLHEETRRGKVSELIEFYEKNGAPKGEIVLVIGTAPPAALSEDEIKARLHKLLKTMSKAEAAASVAADTGWPRKKVYDLALEIAKK